MLTQEIRRHFLEYYKKHQHAIISSSPVLPHDDPTLLFNNAGMNQFKDVFLGKSLRDYNRAATSQKCIRAGGKHNDLENVGHTTRHLTFFEMLGNFSFGDYFKKDAIAFAWEVSTKVFGFDPQRIWPTVFYDDEEAFELWTHYVPAERITRFGEAENFWAMGDTGPCGPCSELLYDRGPTFGPASSPAEDKTGERYLEYWNLVFMQYNRAANGEMEPLPKPSIDTGAGLERVVSLKMGVDSLFETDVLRSLIAQVEEVSGIAYDPTNLIQAPAFRVIADHLRCLAFAIADGVQPSNIDRGYVLRKILRRAVRYGRSLGLEEPFLAKILPRLIETMGGDYVELQRGKEQIAEILTREEDSFFKTLRRGGNMLNQIIEHARIHGRSISGDDAFKLKDTYGLPLEEILLLAKDANLDVDIERYRVLELEAKERSRNVHKGTQQIASENMFAQFAQEHAPCQFLGYTKQNVSAKVLGLVVDGEFVTEMQCGEEGMIILDQTPLYAEMGGQVGDHGVIKAKNAFFQVSNTTSPYKGVIAHSGILNTGVLHVGDFVEAEIDKLRRQKIANNHTATHLLHWALYTVLGEHVKQAGSVVDPQRLRFDFSHHKQLSENEIREIEKLVNAKIRENFAVNSYELSYEEAQRRNDIKQFFGEKYGNVVRVVDVDFSKELCGGTHVQALGNIGLFRIVKESSIAAGMRRIEAVTGLEAEIFAYQSEDLLNQLADSLKTAPAKLNERLEKLMEENKQLSLELKSLKKEQMGVLIHSLLGLVKVHKEMPILISEVTLSLEELRLCVDELIAKMATGVVILGVTAGDKCHILVRVSDDLVLKGVKANEIIREISPIIEGSGGGKANNAQAGGKAPHKLSKALNRALELL